VILYISGPYTVGDTKRNIIKARIIACELWEKGFAVICPHTNTGNFENYCEATYDQYLAGDLEILSKCNAIIMTPDWEISNGAKIEHELAIQMDIPIFYYPSVPTLP
jgi:hypothetical protein